MKKLNKKNSKNLKNLNNKNKINMKNIKNQAHFKESIKFIKINNKQINNIKKFITKEMRDKIIKLKKEKINN